MNHECYLYDFPSEKYGEAIKWCRGRDNGELWVDNGEYATQVNFCPKCGFEAESQVVEEN